MRREKVWVCRLSAWFVAAAVSATAAHATTLIRMDLDRLVADNATVVVGRALDVKSYWNAEGTFMLSDVRFVADETLKGLPGNREFTFTVMGGTLGELSTIIVAGPEVLPGKSYVLFLNPEDLPGAPGVWTVRDLCQGIFDVVETSEGLRAISQATRHPLLPDARGSVEPPGGLQGLRLTDLHQNVRRLAGR
jgi:hypothetical protein